MEDIREALALKTPRSNALHKSAQQVIAREVTSRVGTTHPIYVREAKGSRVIDVDGNEYIDLTMGFGPHVLGHAPDVVIEAVKEAAGRGLHWGLYNPFQEPLARLLVEASRCAEKVIFCNSGTEATLYAIRAARGYTGKTKIGLFEGCYHGAHDYALVMVNRNSPPDSPTPFPMGAGIPQETLGQIMMLPYRNEAAFDIIREHKDELAAVLIEPVQSSNPRLDCGDFLRRLREVCRECGVIFVLDEVITGFRLAYGGGQEVFDVTPDLATYGKALGGGMPIGAVAGSADIMRCFELRHDDPSGPPYVFSGGTFSANPMSMVAGHAAVSHMRDHPEIYQHLAEQSDRLCGEVNRFCLAYEIPGQMMNAFSLMHLFLQRGAINRARDVDESTDAVALTFYAHLMGHGVLVPGIHLAFLSAAHTKEDVDQVIEAFKQSLLDLREGGHI